MAQSYRVTHLKAGWPAGVGIGSYVEFAGGSVPPWAIGKCVPEDAEPLARAIKIGEAPAAAPVPAAAASALDTSPKAGKK